MKPLLTEKLQFITPDGVTINLHNPPKTAVLSQTGWGISAYDMGTSRGPYQHGETVLSSRLNPRTITVTLRYNACNRSEYWQNRTELLDKFRVSRSSTNAPLPGVLRRIYYINGVKTVRDIDVYMTGGLVFTPPAQDRWDSYGIQEDLTFEAKDPIVYNPVPHVENVLTFNPGLILPTDFPFILGGYYAYVPITYVGTWFSYPTLAVEGIADDFAIVNYTTDKSINLAYFISNGEIVTFNLRYNYKTVTNNIGQNLFGYVTRFEDFSIMHNPLAADGINHIYVILTEYAANTAVRITYYDRYIGI